MNKSSIFRDTPRPSVPFRDITRLTKLVKRLLLWGGAWSIVSLVSSSFQLAILNKLVAIEDPKHADDVFRFIGVISFLIFIITVIFFARWIYVANYNVRALGAQGLRRTPAGAVGYFFVPIVNLWFPYQAMKDLWRASQSPLAWQTIKTAPLLRIWWFLWLVDGLMDRIASRLLSKAQDIGSLQRGIVVDMFSDFLYLALCLAAFTLVSQIQAAQQKQKLPEASPEPAAVPPPL